jgi:hypothetical protein
VSNDGDHCNDDGWNNVLIMVAVMVMGDFDSINVGHWVVVEVTGRNNC